MSMYKFDTPSNVTFRNLMGLCEEYAYPLSAMWPSFWLKAAAVHDGDVWRLTFFALVGRWGEAVGIDEVQSSGEALAAVSKRLDASEAWTLLDTLVTEGFVPLSDSIQAFAPDVLVPACPHWQEPSLPHPLSTTADVAEEAAWRWLYAYGTTQWLPDMTVRFKLERRLQADLDRVGVRDYPRYISTHFGQWEYSPNNPSFDMLEYHLDLPLALRITHGAPDVVAHIRPLFIACRPPLTLAELTITSGTRPSSRRAAAPLSVVRRQDENEWAHGVATISSDHDKVWMSAPHLYRTLLHEIQLPTLPTQVGKALAYIYRPNKPKKGAEIWAECLLKGQDDVFEVALLNALARLGVPVLFCGQFQKLNTNVSENEVAPLANDKMRLANVAHAKASGPATEGFDLVALDARHHRAVFISVKGTESAPSERHIETLLKGVATVGKTLENWTVHGLVVCHASATLLHRLKDRGDVGVWGQDELETLWRADTPDVLERLLWALPSVPDLGIFWGHM